MPPFIPITNINAIVSDCFHDYYGPDNPACVLRDVVPILWFGDMDAYWASEKKIVTVAVNPSDKEFIVNGVCSINNRFPGAPANYDSHNPQHFVAYMNAMNGYFKNNAYTKCFWHNEKVLRLFDASYQGVFCEYKNDSGKVFRNTALHIDLKAPVATDPVWGKLDLNGRNAIASIYADYFGCMRRYLDPDILIVSTSAQNVKKAFVVSTSAQNVKEAFVVSTSAQNVKEAFEIKHKNAVIHRTSKRGYVDLHVIHSPVSGKSVNIVWGLNRQNPFSGSGMTYEFIREACCAIRQKIQF